MIATRSQNLFPPEFIKISGGWPIPLRDKTMNNDLVDVEAVNFPDYLKNYKEPKPETKKQPEEPPIE